MDKTISKNNPQVAIDLDKFEKIAKEVQKFSRQEREAHLTESEHDDRYRRD